MTLRALLIDVDGTLADTESHGHRPAYNQAFRELGLGFRWDAMLYRDLLKQPSGRERLLFFVRHHRPDLGLHADAAQADPQAWVERVYQLKSRYYRQYMQSGRVPLRPGIARLIREAHEADVRIALVSNSSRASLNAMLQYGLGPRLSQKVDLAIGGDDLQQKKPSPEPYLLALQRLDVAAHETVAIEDSAMGLRAAVAAGIPTVITYNANTADEDFGGASLVLKGLGDPGKPAKVCRGHLLGPHLTLADLERVVQVRARAA